MPRIKLVETENDVKGLVKDAFEKLGGWSYAATQSGFGAHGIPDRVGCVPVEITADMVGSTIGMFVAIEAKRPGRRGEKNAGATGPQVDILRDIEAAHGIAMLVDGQDDVSGFMTCITRLRLGVVAAARQWFKQHLTNRVNGNG